MRTLMALLAGINTMCASVAFAGDTLDEFTLDKLYGAGVHAYYGKQFEAAVGELTTAIDGGTIDPRAYYFRGLANIHLGRKDDAVRDFQTGAELEADGKSTHAYLVDRALERVQGKARRLIEQERVSARVTAQARQAAAQREEEDKRAIAEGFVLRRVKAVAWPIESAVVKKMEAENGTTSSPSQPAASPFSEPKSPAAPQAAVNAVPMDQPPAPADDTVVGNVTQPAPKIQPDAKPVEGSPNAVINALRKGLLGGAKPTAGGPQEGQPMPPNTFRSQ